MLFVDGIKFFEIGATFDILIRALENDTTLSNVDDWVCKL